MTSESFVVADVSGVTNLEAAKHGRLSRRNLFLLEVFSGAESHHVGVEGSMLADYVREGLVLKHNLAIKASVFISF